MGKVFEHLSSIYCYCSFLYKKCFEFIEKGSKCFILFAGPLFFTY